MRTDTYAVGSLRGGATIDDQTPPGWKIKVLRMYGIQSWRATFQLSDGAGLTNKLLIFVLIRANLHSRSLRVDGSDGAYQYNDPPGQVSISFLTRR